MRRSLVAATAASVLLLTAACGGSSDGGSGVRRQRRPLTLAAITPPSSFAIGEMASSGPEDNYYQAVYDTLLSLDADGQPVANLVDRMELRRDRHPAEPHAARRRHVHRRRDVRRRGGQGQPRAGEDGHRRGRRRPSARVDSVEVVDATHADIVLSRPDPSPAAGAGAQHRLHGQPGRAGQRRPGHQPGRVRSLRARPGRHDAGQHLRLHPQRGLLERRGVPVRLARGPVPRRHDGDPERPAVGRDRRHRGLDERCGVRCRGSRPHRDDLHERWHRGPLPLGPRRRPRAGSRRRPRPAGDQLRHRP